MAERNRLICGFGVPHELLKAVVLVGQKNQRLSVVKNVLFVIKHDAIWI